MSKTFMELFCELPTDLQRCVYKNLFDMTLGELHQPQIDECEDCGYVGEVWDYNYYKWEVLCEYCVDSRLEGKRAEDAYDILVEKRVPHFPLTIERQKRTTLLNNMVANKLMKMKRAAGKRTGIKIF